MQSRLIKWSLVLICNLVIFEALFITAWKVGLVQMAAPSYSLQNVFSRYLVHHPVIGVWHAPETVFRHNKSCFDITYRTNSVGARDVERSRRAASNRILVLGDSFIEGWGVSKSERLTDRLEKRLGIEVMNFGASGHFGPTQYYLLYETLAKNFDHSIVLIGMLPDNDFIDDDLEYAAKGLYRKDYRPYFSGPDYQLVYLNPNHINQIETSADRISRFFREFTFSYLQYRTIARQFSASFSPRERVYSGYYDFTPAQVGRLRFVLSKIKGAADGKRVVVFTIPRLNDFRRYDTIAADPPLLDSMSRLCAELGIEYFDLLKPMKQAAPDYEAYFLKCDGHWNGAGNKSAEKIVAGMLQQEK